MDESARKEGLRETVRAAFKRMNAGDVWVYHHGFLGRDRWLWNGEVWLPNEPLNSLAEAIYEAAEDGVCRLVQAPAQDGKFWYKAIRTKEVCL